MSRIIYFILAFSFSYLAIFAQSSSEVQELIDQNYSAWENVYRDFHRTPELSFMEKNTSAKLATYLANRSYKVTRNVGGYGIVAVMANGEGPTVMIRADMDALPVKEQTNSEFASQVITKDQAGNEVPVMHACGHDMHLSVLSGTADVMWRLKDKWKGTLILIGQPAEERGSGALAMINEGLFENFPRPDYALALHVKAELEAGTIGLLPGFAMANVDMMDITVFGQGGHGAYPHMTIDPVVLSAKIIMNLQTIVSREIAPIEPAVITVGSIHGGTKHNVIPEEVKMELTLRSYSDEVRNGLIDRIRRTCNGTAMSVGLPEDKYPIISLREEYTPALYNDPELTENLRPVFEKTLAKDKVKTVTPVMGGEDFGRYGRVEPRIPILLFWLGAVSENDWDAYQKGTLNLPSTHSPYFIPDTEPTLKTGVKAMTSAALHLLN